MGIIIRQGVKESLVLYLGVFIGALNYMFIYPKFLTPEELGLISYITETALLIVPLIGLGLPSVIIKYFPFFNDDIKHKGKWEFLTMVTITPLISFLIFIGLLFFIRNPIESFFASKSVLIQEFKIYIVPLVFLMLYISIFRNYCQSLKRTAVSALISESIIKVLLPIMVLLYAFSSQFDFNNVIQGLTLIYAFVVLILFLYLRWLNGFKLVFDRKRIGPYLKEIKSYSLFNIATSLGAKMATKMDIIMLGTLLKDLSFTGVYTLAFFITGIIDIPRKSLLRITAPHLAEYFKASNFDKISEVYKRVSLVQLFVGFFVFTCIYTSLDDIFSLIPNGVLYSGGKYVVLILGVAKLVDMITSTNNEIIMFSNKYKFNFYAMIIMAIINACANLILIPRFDIIGAALATFISLALFNLCKMIFIWKTFGLHPFSKKTIFVVLMGSIALYVFSLVPSFGEHLHHHILRLISINTLVTLLFAYTFFKLKISPPIITSIEEFVNKIWRK